MHHADINHRLSTRNQPSGEVRPAFDPRPQSSRQQLHPTSVVYPVGQVAHQAYPSYRPSDVYHPGNTRGPWEGFSVDHDSTLRGQTGFAMQRDLPQTVYVPDGGSSPLYRPSMPAATPRFSSAAATRPATVHGVASSTPKVLHPEIGTLLFGNSTRTQLRDAYPSRQKR